MQNIYTKIITGIHKYFKQANIEKAVIGVSGGVDSALALKLTIDALSAKNVTAVVMPDKGVSSEENMRHAKQLCDFLEVENYIVSINKFLSDYLTLPWKPNDLAYINTKARIRMILLYNFANTNNSLVIGATNKTERLLGYGTKHGDLAADLEILADLYKEDVYALAEYLGLPDELKKKKPTAELYPGQTDEKEIGLSYKEIDSILKQFEKGLSKDEIISKGLSPNSVHKIQRLIDINSHKSLPATVIKIK